MRTLQNFEAQMMEFVFYSVESMVRMGEKLMLVPRIENR